MKIFLIGALIAVFILPIFLTSKEKYLNRGEYAQRSILSILAFLPLQYGMQPGGILTSSLPLALTGLVLIYLLALFCTIWSVKRVNDIGWSRGMVLLTPIPVIGLIFYLFLLFKPGMEKRGPAGRVGAVNQRKVEEMRRQIAR